MQSRDIFFLFAFCVGYGGVGGSKGHCQRGVSEGWGGGVIIDPIPTGPSPSFQTLPSSNRTICTIHTILDDAGILLTACGGLEPVE